jgi:hypothetical protein
MSILDRQGIPNFLICHDDGDLEFEDRIGTLIEFLFVSSKEASDNFEIHPLVQLSSRKWLKIHKEIEQKKEKILSLLSQKFPNANMPIGQFAKLLNRMRKLSYGIIIFREIAD